MRSNGVAIKSPTVRKPHERVSLTVMTSLTFGSPVFCVHQTSMPAQIYQALGSLPALNASMLASGGAE